MSEYEEPTAWYDGGSYPLQDAFFASSGCFSLYFPNLYRSNLKWNFDQRATMPIKATRVSIGLAWWNAPFIIPVTNWTPSVAQHRPCHRPNNHNRLHHHPRHRTASSSSGTGSTVGINSFNRAVIIIIRSISIRRRRQPLLIPRPTRTITPSTTITILGKIRTWDTVATPTKTDTVTRAHIQAQSRLMKPNLLYCVHKDNKFDDKDIYLENYLRI